MDASVYIGCAITLVCLCSMEEIVKSFLSRKVCPLPPDPGGSGQMVSTPPGTRASTMPLDFGLKANGQVRGRAFPSLLLILLVQNSHQAPVGKGTGDYS